MSECIICFDSLIENTVSTHCGHVFHEKCLTKWLKSTKACPKCRQPTSKEYMRRIYLDPPPLRQKETESDFMKEVRSEISEIKKSIKSVERKTTALNVQNREIKEQINNDYRRVRAPERRMCDNVRGNNYPRDSDHFRRLFEEQQTSRYRGSSTRANPFNVRNYDWLPFGDFP